MRAHLCFVDDAPITCICVRGIDHDESLFDIPPATPTEENENG